MTGIIQFILRSLGEERPIRRRLNVGLTSFQRRPIPGYSRLLTPKKCATCFSPHASKPDETTPGGRRSIVDSQALPTKNRAPSSGFAYGFFASFRVFNSEESLAPTCTCLQQLASTCRKKFAQEILIAL